MKFRVLGLGVAAAMWAATASAATVNYNATVALDSSMYDVAGDLVVPLPGGAIPLAVGDTLTGTITFAGHDSITVFPSSTLSGREWLHAFFEPDPGTTAESTGDFTLLGVTGDYDGPSTIVSSPISGAVGFSKITNLTNTSFSFTGISFNISYVDDVDGGGPGPFTTEVTPGFFEVALTPSIISVPEPRTWALLILGFASAGAALRRRRTIKAMQP
jgi:hypothetical protein